jgi:hypothetical protein
MGNMIFTGVLFLMFEAIRFCGEQMILGKRAAGWALVFPRYVFMAYAFVALGYHAALFPLAAWVSFDIYRCRKWWAYWMDKHPFG